MVQPNNIDTSRTKAPTASSTTTAATARQVQFEAAYNAHKNKDRLGDPDHLSKSEFQGAISEATGREVSRERSDALFDLADRDGDQQIGRSEFLKLAQALPLSEGDRAAQNQGPAEPQAGGAEGGAPQQPSQAPGASQGSPAPVDGMPAQAMSLEDLWELLLAMADINGDGQLDAGELEALKNKLKLGANDEGKAAIDAVFQDLARAAGPDQILSKAELGQAGDVLKALPALLQSVKDKGAVQQGSAANGNFALMQPDVLNTLAGLSSLSGGSWMPPADIAA